jgi:hypothetical protein
MIPGVCNFNPETVVLCHAPHPNKGTAIKGPDTWGAYGCSSCHDEMDGRTNRFFVGHEFLSPRLQKVMAWYPAILETQRRLIAKGLMPK